MNAEPVLITGVGRRLGLHLARTFLARGTPVIGTYRSERAGVDTLREAGAELHRVELDDERQIDALVAAVTERHPRLRALIHNASEWLSEADGREPGDVMRRVMQVHVVAPYLMNLALAPLLEASAHPHADIIHVGDHVSSRGSRKHVAYAASKAAQDNLTLSFAARLAPKVKVNSIAPALVIFNDGDDEAYREKARRRSLIGREAGLAEFQDAVDYLLASGYVTGRVLPLDGGRHLVAA